MRFGSALVLAVGILCIVCIAMGALFALWFPAKAAAAWDHLRRAIGDRLHRASKWFEPSDPHRETDDYPRDWDDNTGRLVANETAKGRLPGAWTWEDRPAYISLPDWAHFVGTFSPVPSRDMVEAFDGDGWKASREAETETERQFREAEETFARSKAEAARPVEQWETVTTDAEVVGAREIGRFTIDAMGLPVGGMSAATEGEQMDACCIVYCVNCDTPNPTHIVRCVACGKKPGTVDHEQRPTQSLAEVGNMIRDKIGETRRRVHPIKPADNLPSIKALAATIGPARKAAPGVAFFRLWVYENGADGWGLQPAGYPLPTDAVVVASYTFGKGTIARNAARAMLAEARAVIADLTEGVRV